MHSAKRIFHPTDCSPSDLPAFAHALKLTCLAKAELTMMHVDPTVGREDFEDFPRVRPLLVKWGLLAEGSAKQDVSKLGIQISKVRAVAGDTSAAMLNHLSLHPADLLVVSTHQREGLSRLTHQAVAEPIARGAHANTLFVPTGVEGFVSFEHGTASLRRVLIPVSLQPDPQRAIDAATDLAEMVGSSDVLFELVHIGSDEDFPKLNKPERHGWKWERLIATGDPADWILAAGNDFDVDLIVMMTEGHNSVLDMLRGSTMERVVRGARSPLLALPA
ncbi:putative Universal stress protein [Nitrospira sp. KM1]|uniref:universal stress protein n=1 Tax=Nitrospira sp. KM1 TaxID=1936990 RepID=UPI0013A78C8F|nr:universal stress protein [Nitrospira sp. KM1]BCA56271.1 putative Universal stress protein [Nitrospira sp. KM1]